MRAQITSLIIVVITASLVATLGLVYLPRAEPERHGFSDRFRHFFGRTVVTIGFWSILVWLLFGRVPATHP